MLTKFIKNYKKTFILLILVFMYAFSWLISFDNNKQFRYGVTFSQPYAEYLGLDWKKVFIDVLDDLKIQNYRLVAYWNTIEVGPGIYDFQDLDWQVSEVQKRGGNVVLALGLRVPRWPECHVPTWAVNLPKEQLMTASKDFINVVVKHYQDNKTIIVWQVENEPFLSVFGQCQSQSEELVSAKVLAVKELSKLPVAITDSGELGPWLPTARISDSLGVSMYRRVQQPIIGYINYPLPPIYYTARAWLVKILVPNKNVYISELQLEPWINGGIIDASILKQKEALPEKSMNNFIMYARRTGLNPIYFWGVEWWYYMREKGEFGYWNNVKSLIEVNAGLK